MGTPLSVPNRLSSSTSRRFLSWACPHIILGLTPFLVNFFVTYVEGAATYYSVFKVDVLMFFVILLCGTTLTDKTVQRLDSSFDILIRAVLVLLLVTAALFLGIYSFYLARPPASGPYLLQLQRLVNCSVILSGGALLIVMPTKYRSLLLTDSDPTSPD